MATIGDHFHELLTRIEDAIKSLLEHDIPEVKAAAGDAAQAVAALRATPMPAAPQATGVLTPVPGATMAAAASIVPQQDAQITA